ncbi:MAG: hypothetical protein WC822_04590 [Candidatus Paceibacterota bacterium]|jgi:hypothetical protein
MSSPFKDAIAKLLAVSESVSATEQERGAALTALSGIKAVVAPVDYEELVKQAHEYIATSYAKQQEQEQAKAKKDAETKEWQETTGATVLKEYAILEEKRQEYIEELATAKYNLKAHSEQMHKLLTDNSCVIFDDNGTTRIRKTGTRTTNGTTSSTPRTKGEPKVWVGTIENKYPSLSAGALAQGVTVGADSAARALKRANVAFGKL